jgi:coenzyme F420 hydrogenase subunit beta
MGWPGHFAVKLKGNPELVRLGSYAESWSFLQAYRPFSVHLSPDGTGEDADITCGDPWYRKIDPDEPGSSLVMIRTELGRRVFADALKRGYVAAKRLGVDKVLRSQGNLFEKRGAIWGRLLVLKLLGIPIPRLVGFSLFRNWLRLSFMDKSRSVFGTARRVIMRRLYRRLQLGKEMKS